MHEWLLRLTRPEDPLAWTWIAIAAGYAVAGIVLGWPRTRSPPEPLPRPLPDPILEPIPEPPPSSR